MEIKEIEVGNGKIDVELEIKEKGEVKEFEKFGNQGKVCPCKCSDGTDEITVTLWNEDVDKINVGDKIKITNGYCSEFQGEKQLTAGKFGQLEKVED
tara:strand:- start:10 stop:300 length:291 start_codon:yes stop_codon:yes gene_type:complete